MNDIPPAANFSDALRRLGHQFQTMRSSIKPVFSPVKLVGPAYPVRCYAGATWALENAIEEAPPGSVLVVDGGGYQEAVLMGGLMSLRAKMRGVLGAVIDGAVRDQSELRREQWPIFAAAFTPSAGTHDQQGGWNTPITCGGIAVHPSDWIVGDDDGVVVVPQSLWGAAVEAARAVEKKEQFIECRLREGYSLSEAVSQFANTSGLNSIHS